MTDPDRTGWSAIETAVYDMAKLYPPGIRAITLHVEDGVVKAVVRDAAISKYRCDPGQRPALDTDAVKG